MSLANVQESSSPSAPGGFISALPLPFSGPAHIERISLPGTTLLSQSRFAATFFKSGARVTTLRSIFGSVVIKKVEISLIVPKYDGLVVAAALVPANLTAPTDFAAAASLPSVELKTSNNVTATQYSIELSAGFTPGIEWDLAIEQIRFGHVALLLAHNQPVVQKDPVMLGLVQVFLHVECSGQGYGAAVGGTTI